MATHADDDLSLPAAIAEVLDNIAAKHGFKQPALRVESGSNVGDGYTSVIYRVTIQDEAEHGRPDDLKTICKTVSSGTAEGFLKIIFLAEDCMYKKVLPAMEDIAHLEEPLPWPKCLYSSALSPPCLVMSDLKPLGFAMADRMRPLDGEHCRLALQQLARYHGAGMALQALRPVDFRAATEVLDRGYNDPLMRQVFQGFFKAFKNDADMIKDRFSDEVNKKLKEIFDGFSEDFFSMLVIQPDSPANALVHGDCHINNMMFQYDKGGAVTGCRLIDFQTAHYGCTAWDLCSLLLPCTDKATRDAHWDALLRGYHDELQATLRAAGIANPDAIYSWDQFQDALRANYKIGLYMAPAMLNLLGTDEEAKRELRDSIRDMDKGDFDSDALIAKMAFKETPAMKERFGDLVQDLLDWGWL